ncbi:MAG: phosphatidylglycerol lysyltransferase domain-containing protein [Melioribacteraceae bacterium]|nr:phosphatidylglycerol lysyltransferase domain-containing protein [Melioribacteraceae bacterium]MCF8265374.1 phosphatidylglycerol lysyltransferase domain-containing protein [Melioribacteraceae bacterium]MCF8412286.1 phosphatidylglycerol lysyltransferase domain-containing protein [Melioribacteraceae bacterium]
MSKNNFKYLPLSWHISENPQNQIERIELNYKGTTWLSLARFYSQEDFNDFFTSEMVSPNQNIFLRGLRKEHSDYLFSKGFHTYKIGAEAVLRKNSTHFEKASLKELIRRGNKKGEIVEKAFSDENIKKIHGLRLKSPFAKLPLLTNLFNTEFTSDMRLFVFEQNNEWLGLILCSKNSNTKYQVELILRKQNNPVGIMEALIHHAFEIITNGEINELSLGEVPFTFPSSTQKVFEFFIKIFGKTIGFAYNAEGLFNFKNKFNPVWEDLFIASTSRLNLRLLTALSSKSNFTNLLIYKARN